MMLSKTKDITAHNIYSIYNKLFSHLDAAEAKLKNKGQKKLSKYYTATEYEPYGDIYALATIFSPSKKLRYFSSTDWQGDIDYANRYQELETSGVAIDENDDCDLDAACASQNQPLEELTKPDDDEIARYLARGIERQKPRLFWKEYEKSFPTLARIARDILSIPASGFATNFDLRQEELEIIKEHLSQSEAALLDQTRRSLPQLEVLEPISDNEEEDQETGLEATQHTESGDNDSDDDRAERCRRAKGKQPQKRPCEAVEEDDELPEMLVDGSIPSRSGRIRKQPRLPDGFQLDL
ncbi:hypothetical protein PDIDSM_7765 [Penicillium digitatum]|nr:hypothetical protein PDIDSM_7765 [Penicillium digitatum]